MCCISSRIRPKGRCALALKAHKKELCECTDQERADFAEDLAKASGAIKELWGCTKLNLGSFGDTNPHLHFHIVPKYEGGFEFGGAFAITNPEPVYLKDEEYQEMISALKVSSRTFTSGRSAPAVPIRIRFLHP